MDESAPGSVFLCPAASASTQPRVALKPQKATAEKPRMPLQTLLRTALPFMAGGALAIFVAELTRDVEPASAPPFPDTWFREAEHAPKHLWTGGEPVFDWGD